MKSTWRQDKSQWTPLHYVVNFIDPFYYDATIPVFAKTDPVPVAAEWWTHVWILAHALWPLLVQQIYVMTTGSNPNGIAMFALYSFACVANALHEAHVLRRVAHQVGYFDGDKHPRDELPDEGLGRALSSVLLALNIRPIFTLYLSYNRDAPIALSRYLPLELFLYAIAIDFFFYIYHRSCHEVDFLWRYHRTHHLTKHPNPFLGAYADAEQETIEIAIVPILAFTTLRLIGLPMGFYDWWICQQYVIFSEASGHSGLRMLGSAPGLASPVLALFGCELVIEDHDLHHRKGWKKSHSYGKQTRLWDRLFGTCGERIECLDMNVDRSRKIYLPLL